MLSRKDSERGRLLQQFVRARIVNMIGIDVGLYDFDRHNAIYFFIVSPDEQIYLRYGGRDAASPDTYLDLDSFALALRRGLAQHARWSEGTLPRAPRPAELRPKQIEALREKEIARNRCVECHMIGDYLAVAQEQAGKLDKRQNMFRSPDLKRIGLHLDVPRGLAVARVEGPAQAAGLRAGDEIVSFAGHEVLTFGDLLFRYDQTERQAKHVSLAVERTPSGQIDNHFTITQ